jgi:hypothetical protein
MAEAGPGRGLFASRPSLAPKRGTAEAKAKIFLMLGGASPAETDRVFYGGDWCGSLVLRAGQGAPRLLMEVQDMKPKVFEVARKRGSEDFD